MLWVVGCGTHYRVHTLMHVCVLVSTLCLLFKGCACIKDPTLYTHHTALVLGSCDVVAATCVGAGDPRLEGAYFPLVVVDEAAQATEPVTMVAIAAACPEALVLVGDPKQLPATVKSNKARGG